MIESGELPVGVPANVTLIVLNEASSHSIHINDELLVEFEQILGGT